MLSCHVVTNDKSKIVMQTLLQSHSISV